MQRVTILFGSISEICVSLASVGFATIGLDATTEADHPSQADASETLFITMFSNIGVAGWQGYWQRNFSRLGALKKSWMTTT